MVLEKPSLLIKNGIKIYNSLLLFFSEFTL